MDPAQYVVRRANVDDLPGLKQLWERTGLQVLDLERRLTEFQLVSSREGDLFGAIGLHLEGKQALLHSEAFVSAEVEDEFRPLLWERLRTLTRNHGVARIWTREQAPHWHQAGFELAEAELLKKLPKFGDSHHQWSTLALREDSADAISLDKEFELFQQASRASMEDMMGRARRFKIIALTIGMAIFVVAIGVGFYLMVRWMRESNVGSRRR